MPAVREDVNGRRDLARNVADHALEERRLGAFVYENEVLGLVRSPVGDVIRGHPREGRRD